MSPRCDGEAMLATLARQPPIGLEELLAGREDLGLLGSEKAVRAEGFEG